MYLNSMGPSDVETWLSAQTSGELITEPTKIEQFQRPKMKRGVNAWAAGIFDSTGWVRIHKLMGKTRMSYTLKVYMRAPNRARAAEIISFYGGRDFVHSSTKKTIWNATGPDAIWFLRRIRQHVHWKKEVIRQAERFDRWKRRTNWVRRISITSTETAEFLRLAFIHRLPEETLRKMAQDNVKYDFERLLERRMRDKI